MSDETTAPRGAGGGDAADAGGVADAGGTAAAAGESPAGAAGAGRRPIADSVLDLVGGTPLVRLHRVTDPAGAQVLVKLEYLNPGGSSKDRIAVRIVDAAEREGLLTPGGTIVEPTSGNTGVGLALVAQQRGYRCVFVLPDKVGKDKRDVLEAYGAEIVVTPTSVEPDDPRSYYSVSDRLARDIPGAFKPDQYSNPNGPASHHATTGPEIWRDTQGAVTSFVAGIGTGGTISGTGRYLKEVSDGRVRIVGADPEGSIYSGADAHPYLVEGVGEDFLPGAYDPTVVDEVIVVTDAESFAMTRRLAREEGLLVGGSSGMAVVAAVRHAATLGPDDTVVVLLPDGGRGYLAKIFDDGWMARHGFLAADGDDDPSVADALERAGQTSETLPHVTAAMSVADALAALDAAGADELPVLSAVPPVMLGEVAGGVRRTALVAALAGGRASGSDPVADHVGPVPALAGAHRPAAEAADALAAAPSLLVLDGGKPVGVLTERMLAALWLP